jgi:hypothetical protein
LRDGKQDIRNRVGSAGVRIHTTDRPVFFDQILPPSFAFLKRRHCSSSLQTG